jgi:hypothetical protein
MIEEQESKAVAAAFQSVVRSYRALQGHLKKNPDTPELVTMLAQHTNAITKLSPLLSRADVDDWPDFIDG